MSFREKSAWITLATIVLVSGLFILHLPRPWSLTPTSSGFIFHVLLLSVTAFVVIEIIAHVIVAIRSPADARAPRDERERLIALKATSLAAYVYAFLSLGSVSLIHVGANQIGVAYCVLLSFVIAEVVNYAARIVYYRRGV
jgi:ABC-type xylose transport system permease subunit